MDKQKIIKEALNLITVLGRLEATSKQIRNTSSDLIILLKEINVIYNELPLPGVADLISLASRASDIGTKLDLMISLMAEAEEQAKQL